MVSLYERLERNDQLLEVNMDGVQILEPDNDEIAIGTKDLNGCSALVIIDKGVIMAHIAPMSPKNQEAQASSGFPHFMAQARAAVTSMKNHEALFEENTTTWGIFARLGSDIPLDHYAAWVRKLFEHLGSTMNLASYDVNSTDRRERHLPTGSVFVIKKEDRRPRLFLEDQEKTPTAPRIQSVAGPSTQVTAGSAPVQQQWQFREGRYLKVRGTIVVEEQSGPPVNEPVLINGRYFLWDGSSRWMDNGQGGWAKV